MQQQVHKAYDAFWFRLVREIESRPTPLEEKESCSCGFLGNYSLKDIGVSIFGFSFVAFRGRELVCIYLSPFVLCLSESYCVKFGV